MNIFITENNETQNLSFNYASFLAGAGKTHSMIERVVFLAARGQRILIAMPTFRLIDQTAKDSRFAGTKISVIHSEDNVATLRSVISRIQSKLNDAEKGEVVIITHAALLRLPHVPREKAWHLFVDEIPSVTPSIKFSLPEHKDEFLSLFTIKQYNNDYVSVESSDRTCVVKQNHFEDEWWKTDKVKNFVHYLESSHYEVFTEINSLEKFVKGDANNCIMHAVMKPSIFANYASVTIMGALMEMSLLYKLWGLEQASFGVKWHVNTDIKPKYTAHQNDHLITLKYCIEENFSKKKQKKKVTDDVTLIDAIKLIVAAEFEGKDYIVAKNNSTDASELEFGESVSVISHGLNSYTHYTNFAFLAALNETPAQVRFLANVYGFDESEIYNAITLNSGYQLALRTAIRNPANDKQVVGIVPDLRMAQLLQEHVFPNCKVEPVFDFALDEKKSNGRPRIHASEAEKKRTTTNAKKKSLIDGLVLLNEYISAATPETRIIPITGFRESQHVNQQISMYESIYNANPSSIHQLNHGEFIEFLRDVAFPSEYKEKTDNKLISPAVFTHKEGADTQRGLDNVAYLQGIWLDCDEGDMSISEFVDLFPKYEMYIFNSFSSGKSGKKEDRWRVFIPTTEYLTKEAYEYIIKRVILLRITDKLKKYGKSYCKKNPDAKRHGFDESKFTASSMFYLPCQSGYGDSYFLEFTGGKRQPFNPRQEISRNSAMEPVEQPQEAVKPKIQAVEPIKNKKGTDPRLIALREKLHHEEVEQRRYARDAIVHSAIERCASASKGEGNHEFYVLACRLAAAGLGWNEAQQLLQSVAKSMYSPTERKAQISSFRKLF